MAGQFDWHPTKITRIETGQWSRLNLRDVRDLLDIYGLTDEEHREMLLQLARECRQQVLKLGVPGGGRLEHGLPLLALPVLALVPERRHHGADDLGTCCQPRLITERVSASAASGVSVAVVT